MTKYFAQLRPMERRMMLGVAVALVIFLNWVFIWPYFGTWGAMSGRYDNASRKLKNYQAAIDQAPALERQVKEYQSAGNFVAPQDQGINFIRAIQNQAVHSGVQIQNNSAQITSTNDAFFIEQRQNINVSGTEDQLVSFLYQLGNDPAMIRVRDLELQPDTSHMKLNANVMLVANYQKNPKPAADAAKPSTAMAK